MSIGCSECLLNMLPVRPFPGAGFDTPIKFAKRAAAPDGQKSDLPLLVVLLTAEYLSLMPEVTHISQRSPLEELKPKALHQIFRSYVEGYTAMQHDVARIRKDPE